MRFRSVMAAAAKHAVLMLLCAAAALMCLCSCGEQLPSPKASEIVDAILASQTEGEEFTAASDEEIEIIFGCDIQNYSDVEVMYATDAGFADVIAVFKSADDDAQTETQQLLNDFLKKRHDDFAGYAPQEVKKIDASSVITYGSYDVLVSLSDFDAAKDAVDALFKS